MTNIEGTADRADQDVTDWRYRVGYHPATPDTAPMHDSLRRRATVLGEEIIFALPFSRERSLALTHLEETLMWANKAVAMLTPLDTNTPHVARVLPADASS